MRKRKKGEQSHTVRIPALNRESKRQVFSVLDYAATAKMQAINFIQSLTHNTKEDFQITITVDWKQDGKP